MDPIQTAFLVELAIYLAAALLIYIAGHTHGRAGKRKAYRDGSRDMEKLIRDRAVIDLRDNQNPSR